MPEETIAVVLDPNEVAFIERALSDYLAQGRSRWSPEIAQLAGFNSAEAMAAQLGNVAHQVGELGGGGTLRLVPDDWGALLVLCETSFSNDTFGIGRDWFPITGIPEDIALRSLRSLQHKIPHSSPSVTFSAKALRSRGANRPGKTGEFTP